MIKWAPSRAGLSLVFLALALSALFFDRQTYKRYSSANITVSPKRALPTAGNTVQTTIKDLISKLNKPKVEVERYAVAADNNLFSPIRKAWRAPVAVIEKKEESKSSAPAQIRRDVVLYGTYISGKTRKAMLHFKRFRKGRMLVTEGDEAKDRDSGDVSRRQGPVYKLFKVESRKVTLLDERGNKFSIGLYDNKVRRPLKTVNKSNIKVDRSAPPQVVKRNASQPGKMSATGRSAAGKTGAPPLSARQIRKLSVEEKNSLVAKGVLKKHNTPFGPVFKRVQK